MEHDLKRRILHRAVFLYFIPYYILALAPPAPAQDMPPAPGPVADSPDAVCPVLPGSRIPDVTLRATDGSPVRLLEVVRQKPTILIVYRGGW